MAIDLTKTLTQLVAIASVNPMGQTAEDSQFYETALTDHLVQLLRQLGLATQRQQVAQARDNLIARLDGSILPEQGGPLLVFDAHQDTVPATGMSIDPWAAEVRGGRLYGRGACDVKGGMAAMLGAIARLADERPRGIPTVVMSCTVDEEFGLTGVRTLVSSWGTPTSLIPRIPTAVVVAEPTDLNVVVAHKGVIRWRCHAGGRAAHSSDPSLGENAIYRMGRALAVIEHYQSEVLGPAASHPLCGSPTMSVGTIHGGTSINIVPERCTIEIEIRLPPGGDPDSARQELIDRLAAELGEGVLTHDDPYMQAPPLSDRSNSRLADRLRTTARSVASGCRLRGVPYATNAAYFAAAGAPAVVFGPGSIQQAHTKDEWLPLDQLEQASEILYCFALEIGREG